MNRKFLFGIALFFAVVGLALVGNDNQAQAGLGCGGGIFARCGGNGCGGVSCGGRRHHRHFRGLFRGRCGGSSCAGDCGGGSCGGVVVNHCPPSCGGCGGHHKCSGGLFARLRARRAARCGGCGGGCGGAVAHCCPDPCPPAPSCCGTAGEVTGEVIVEEHVVDEATEVPIAPEVE